MTQKGSQVMDIVFTGKKAAGTLIAHQREVIAFVKKLDSNDKVETYQISVELTDWAKKISLVGIRKAYQSQNWTSDCVIMYRSGERAVREFVKKEWLTKRAEVEKLELSRRYWQYCQVYNWGVIII